MGSGFGGLGVWAFRALGLGVEGLGFVGSGFGVLGLTYGLWVEGLGGLGFVG